jgi:hypothetical protein
MRAAPSSSWVNDIAVTPALRDELARTGVVKLDALLGADALAFLHELCTSEGPAEVKATTKDGGERKVMTSRAANVGNKHPAIAQIVRSPAFLRVMAALVPEPLLFAKGMVFELTPGDLGYQWHFGVKAFQFIRPTDLAYSLWIPLHEVGPRTGGGVAYVPADIWSGRERVKLVAHQLAKIAAAAPADASALVEAMAAEYSLSFVTPYERELLHAARVEPSFVPGDVLLFSRWAWHCSSSFLSSAATDPQLRRVAYTMRFVDARARMSRTFIHDLNLYYELRKQGGQGSSGGRLGGPRPFAELADGELLSRSSDCLPAF